MPCSASRSASARRLPIVAAAQRHRARYLCGAYLGCDIQTLPEAVCVDTGREVGYGTVPLTRVPSPAARSGRGDCPAAVRYTARTSIGCSTDGRISCSAGVGRAEPAGAVGPPGRLFRVCSGRCVEASARVNVSWHITSACCAHRRRRPHQVNPSRIVAPFTRRQIHTSQPDRSRTLSRFMKLAGRNSDSTGRLCCKIWQTLRSNRCKPARCVQAKHAANWGRGLTQGWRPDLAPFG